MTARVLLFSLLLSAAALAAASPATAQNCTRTGTDVTCDDGRRGVFTGDAIVWPDGTRANLASPHPSVIIGNKQSVVVGKGAGGQPASAAIPCRAPAGPATVVGRAPAARLLVWRSSVRPPLLSALLVGP